VAELIVARSAEIVAVRTVVVVGANHSGKKVFESFFFFILKLEFKVENISNLIQSRKHINPNSKLKTFKLQFKVENI
jgi:hypothetical protein